MDSSAANLQEALEGRLPVLPHERIYTRYTSLLSTTAVLSAASYAYLVGGALTTLGNARLTTAGYLVGLIIGEVVVVLAVGVPSYRNGVDTVDAAKSTLGTRGAALVLVSVLATCLGWAYVLIAMTAEGIGSLAHVLLGFSSYHEGIVVGAALLVIAAVWLLARRGPKAMEHLSTLCAPGQIAIACILLLVLLYKFGLSALWQHTGATAPQPTSARMMQLAFGLELGFANALSLLPYLGGLARFVRHRHHLLGPTVLGSGIVGAWFIAAVAALAAAAEGDSNPIAWVMTLAGAIGGSAIISFLLIANLGTLVVQIYVAGVAAQQMRAIAAMRWEWVLVLMLLPGVLLAFRTKWLLAQVASLLGYSGVMFVGMAGVMIADYFILRRQHVELAHLFARGAQGRYFYVAGVNWPAIAAMLLSGVLYLLLFDPVALKMQPLFRFLGAGIPAVLAAMLCYGLSMKLSRRWLARGASGAITGTSPPTLDVGV